MAEDLYVTLGISKTASQDEIKSAFRKLAKQFHPDIYQGDKKVAEEKFKKIAEAYEILSDPQTREQYDAYGYEGMKNRGGFHSGFENMHMEDIFSGFSDIFGDIFGFDIGGGRPGGRGGSRRMHGEDIRHDTAINFEEAAVDTKETIEITRKEPCEVCHGEGIKPGTSKKTCPTCGGNGKVRQSSGFFSMVTTCPACRGEGQVADSLCESCGGKKVKSKKRKIEVTIPAGVENGSYLKLSGEGHTGLNNGENGDLYVVINIRPHEIFERDGNDVVLRLPITLTQAALGEEIEVPTIYGNHKIVIPAGIQNGEVISLRGKGFPVLHSAGRGDMHIIALIEVPKGMNSKLKDALNNVRLLETEDNYPQARKANKNMKKYKK
jgi:molecular chaperone DnaJ